MPDFAKRAIQTYTIALGEQPIYKYAALHNMTADKTIPTIEHVVYETQIYAIWFFWILQSVMMVLIMLNFIIAVINDTYVNSYQNSKQIA